MGRALIPNSTVTPKAEVTPKPTRGRPCIVKETRDGDTFGVTDRPGDRPGPQPSVAWHHCLRQEAKSQLNPNLQSFKGESSFCRAMKSSGDLFNAEACEVSEISLMN